MIMKNGIAVIIYS